jgi:hypothetical protein
MVNLKDEMCVDTHPYHLNLLLAFSLNEVKFAISSIDIAPVGF